MGKCLFGGWIWCRKTEIVFLSSPWSPRVSAATGWGHTFSSRDTQEVLQAHGPCCERLRGCSSEGSKRWCQERDRRGDVRRKNGSGEGGDAWQQLSPSRHQGK